MLLRRCKKEKQSASTLHWKTLTTDVDYFCKIKHIETSRLRLTTQVLSPFGRTSRLPSPRRAGGWSTLTSNHPIGHEERRLTSRGEAASLIGPRDGAMIVRRGVSRASTNQRRAALFVTSAVLNEGRGFGRCGELWVIRESLPCLIYIKRGCDFDQRRENFHLDKTISPVRTVGSCFQSTRFLVLLRRHINLLRNISLDF